MQHKEHTEHRPTAGRPSSCPVFLYDSQKLSVWGEHLIYISVTEEQPQSRWGHHS